MKKLFIAVTAHDPLNRIEKTLRVLKGYEQLPATTDVEIFIDHDHAHDLEEFSAILDKNISGCQVSVAVAGPEYHQYYLCWAHKGSLRSAIHKKHYDYYMYSENDMLFTYDNFEYWYSNKDSLRSLNLEPGFCRFEKVDGQKIPFDNYRKWSITRPTRNVWGELPHKNEFILSLNSRHRVGWMSLGNPYSGLMLLDQQDAEVYVNSDACDPDKSYALTGKRNWPIADRSSMGLCFHDLLDGQEHRRVVAVTREDTLLVIPDYALVEHLDTKYAPALIEEGDIITTDTMLCR